MKTTCHLRIRGRVQGVGFRAYVAYKARSHSVAGWVRNRSDGSVEAVLHGEAQAVQAVVDAAHRGPRNARVTGVEMTGGEGEYEGFEQRATV